MVKTFFKTSWKLLPVLIIVAILGTAYLIAPSKMRDGFIASLGLFYKIFTLTTALTIVSICLAAILIIKLVFDSRCGQKDDE